MADEIRINVNSILSNGTLYHEFAAGQINVDQATQGLYAGVVNVGASEEDMPVGDIVTPGILHLKNISSSGYVTWGPKSAGSMVPLGKLEAGGAPVVLRLDPTVTIRWISSSGTSKVLMALYED